MECPNCHYENPENAKFCVECGHSYSDRATSTIRSPSFNEKLDQIQKYLPVGIADKILSQRGRIEGERKQVTVMFSDMVNFTPMVERLGPEKAYSLMDQVYEILIHTVHDFEGTVNEMTGDGIMALFGAPLAVEDAPQRAIRSALAINDGIRTFNELNDVSPPIRMRTGIHTGNVIVGTLGNDLRVEFKAVGDTVNLASRMEGLAEPDSVYVSDDTYRLTKEIFSFDYLGGKDIKGKAEPVKVYKAISVRKDVYRPRLGEERMIYSEMVGRDKELNKLELQVMKAINGEGSVVNVIGEAGIGKSRLIAELKNLDIMRKVRMLEGRAISIGKNLSFHPIIDLIKHWAKINVNDDESNAFKKLEIAIQSVDHESSKDIIPFVGTLMGMKLPGKHAERVNGIEGEILEKLILKNLRDLLSRASVEATQSAGDETRTLIKEHVADEMRATQLIELVDQLENNLMAYVQIQTAHNNALRIKNADYEATREDMQNLYDAYNRDTRDIGMKIAKTHLEMTKLATPEEWAVISKPKHRIGGF